MLRRATIIRGQPDAGVKRFCHTLADAHAAGAAVACREITRIELEGLYLPILQEDFEDGKLPRRSSSARCYRCYCFVPRHRGDQGLEPLYLPASLVPAMSGVFR
jgi:hypothetical protein